MPNRFLLLLTVVAATLGHAIPEKSSIGCMVKYLKTNKLMGSGRTTGYMNSVHSDVVINSTDCESGIENFRSNFYETIATELREDEDTASVVDCVIAHLRKVQFAEVSMKKYVYENSERMSRRNRRKATKAIDYTLEKKLQTAMTVCVSDEIFGGLFDEIYAGANETSSDEEVNDEEEYCLKKYLVDHDFVNTSIHTINLNPKNIDTTSVDCDDVTETAVEELIQSLEEEFQDEILVVTKKTKRCIRRVVTKHGFVGNILRVGFYGEIGLTEEVRIEERNKFIESMKATYEAIISC